MPRQPAPSPCDKATNSMNGLAALAYVRGVGGFRAGEQAGEKACRVVVVVGGGP